jgi:hypothetical protein
MRLDKHQNLLSTYLLYKKIIDVVGCDLTPGRK